MGSVTIIKHPVVQQQLARLRDKTTRPPEFRTILGGLATLMIYEATRSFAVKPVTVTTPLGRARGARLRREVVVVPILRAGLGMMESIFQLIPTAQVGFIGIKRDETSLQAIFYHQSLPSDLSKDDVILIDPMLATGGSTVKALDLLVQRGARRVCSVNLVASNEGIRKVHLHHPNVAIFTAAIDPKLDKRGYIVPGLGDAGDRLFGV